MYDYKNNMQRALKKEQTVALIQFLSESFDLIVLVVLSVMTRSLLLMTGAVSSISLLVQAWVVYKISKRLLKNESYEYDYGMGKFESFGGFIANLFMMIGLVGVLFASLILIFSPSQPGQLLLLAAATKGIVTIADITLYVLQRDINKTAKSKLFDAENHVLRKNLSFDFIAISAIVALYIFRYFPGIVYLELLLCFVYSIIMIIKLIEPLKLCAYDLLDKTMDEDIQLKVMKAMASGNELYESFHTIRTRSSGQNIYIDLLIGFDKDKTYEEITGALKNFETLIKAEIPNCVVSIVLTD